MSAFLYGTALQWKLDLRSKTLLISCYLVPLAFFGVMGGIFTAIMPGAETTLLPAMTVFGVTMGAFIGLPPSLVEIYGSDVKRSYQVSGVPLCFGLATTSLSAFVHLLLMSAILYVAAPLAFDAALPANPLSYWCALVIFILVSLSIAGVVGLAVRDSAKTTMVSMVLFLPSILFSGILFPAALLPVGFQKAGLLFPATWGHRWMAGGGGSTALWPLLGILLAAAILCAILLRRIARR